MLKLDNNSSSSKKKSTGLRDVNNNKKRHDLFTTAYYVYRIVENPSIRTILLITILGLMYLSYIFISLYLSPQNHSHVTNNETSKNISNRVLSLVTNTSDSD